MEGQKKFKKGDRVVFRYEGKNVEGVVEEQVWSSNDPMYRVRALEGDFNLKCYDMTLRDTVSVLKGKWVDGREETITVKTWNAENIVEFDGRRCVVGKNAYGKMVYFEI